MQLYGQISLPAKQKQTAWYSKHMKPAADLNQGNQMSNQNCLRWMYAQV